MFASLFTIITLKVETLQGRLILDQSIAVVNSGFESLTGRPEFESCFHYDFGQVIKHLLTLVPFSVNVDTIFIKLLGSLLR